MTQFTWPPEAVEAAANERWRRSRGGDGPWPELAPEYEIADMRAALTAAAEAMIKSGKAWHISPTDTVELNMIRNTGSTLIIALPE
jgi:hypothetical protein